MKAIGETSLNVAVGNEAWTVQFIDEAFKKLKRMLCSALILALPNFENNAPPFVLDTDASDVAVGGVLSQRDKEGREHVIAYASIRLNKKMRQKSATEPELFATFTMVRHFT
ncbi:Retrovirus-related Pol polyprotein from transposon opu [Taenia solium]|eukprot:TsM_001013200 transcript=TsM_001013200 gene=TsM_001013200